MSNWVIKKSLTAVLMLLCVPQCVLWCLSGSCHCNSHKKSSYWSRLRNSMLLGGLHAFNLTLSEMDAHLRHAGAADRPLTCILPASWRLLLHVVKLILNIFFFFFRENAADLQKGRVCGVLYISEGEVANGVWTEHSKSAASHSWVSDRSRFHSLQSQVRPCPFTSNI